MVLGGGHEALGRLAAGLEVAGERGAHGAEDDRGNLAPLGKEQLRVRPIVGRESAHDQDHAVGPRLRALGRQGIDAGQVHDRLGIHLQIDAQLLGGVGHGLRVVGLPAVDVVGSAGPSHPVLVGLGTEEDGPNAGPGRRRRRGDAAPKAVAAMLIARAETPTVVMNSRRSIDANSRNDNENAIRNWTWVPLVSGVSFDTVGWAERSESHWRFGFGGTRFARPTLRFGSTSGQMRPARMRRG